MTVLSADAVTECFARANWVRLDDVGKAMLFLNGDDVPEGMFRRATVWAAAYGWCFQCWYLKGATAVQPITTDHDGAPNFRRFTYLDDLVFLLASSSVQSHPIKVVA